MAPSLVLRNGQSQSISVTVGTNFSLTVSIIRFNLPLTSITWTHNGESIIERVNITELSSPGQASVTALLQRTSVIPLDTGSYVITAINPVGSETFEFNVIVTGKLMHSITLFERCLFVIFIELSASPLFLPSNASLVKDEGQSLVLRCTAKGFPRPTITWLLSDSERRTFSTSTSTDTEGFLVITSTLMTQNVHRSDAGLYTCNASNTQGTKLQSFNITVDCKLCLS